MKIEECCEIEARNISYQIQIPNSRTHHHPFKIWNKEEEPTTVSIEQGPTSRVRHVLKNVSCRAKPSEILAIVGPSGAGKSTLLEILAGKLTPLPSSVLLVNRAPISKHHFRKVCGYVTQADLLFPLLTVRETLLFSAKLRLGFCQRTCSQRVDSLLVELGLAHVAYLRVGSCDGKVRGVSGGERRRVSIGVEAVHDPKVLILDEPTSGLDSASAVQVVELVKGMAEGRGRTVVMSLHQPGSRIVKQLDAVLLLAEGSVVYRGSVEELQGRLREVGLEVPTQVNVVEFAIDSIEAMRTKEKEREWRVLKEEKEEEEEEDDDEVVERVRRRCTLQQLFEKHMVVNEEEGMVSSN